MVKELEVTGWWFNAHPPTGSSVKYLTDWCRDKMAKPKNLKRIKSNQGQMEN